MSVPDTVMVLAKEPVPGRVRARLCPPHTTAHAAALAGAALADTVALVAGAPVRRRVLCLHGRLPPHQTRGFEVIPHFTGTLNVRIPAALTHIGGPVSLIGMDTPQLLIGDLDLPGLSRTTDPRRTHERGHTAQPHAWLGPACDGGLWAIGQTHPDPALVLGVAMSQPDTGTRQLDRLRAAGLPVTVLRTVRDVDTAADIPAEAALAPGTRFAGVAAALTTEAASSFAPPAAAAL